MTKILFRSVTRFLLTTGLPFFFLVTAHSQTGVSQLSTSVSVPSSSTLGRATGRVLIAQPPIVSKWERILAQSHNDVIFGSMTGEDLVAALRQIGLPVSLDPSAWEDEFDEDTEAYFPNMPGMSLYDRMNLALKKHNAVFTFSGDRPLIISLSDEMSPEFFFTATYNVTNFGVGRNAIMDSIQGTIDTDGWRESGTGEGTLRPVLVNGQRLLVASQTYTVHLQMREFFRQLSSTGFPNGSIPISSSAVSNQLQSRPAAGRRFTGATATQLPGRAPTAVRAPARFQRPSNGGGGVFSIPSDAKDAGN